MTQPIFRFCVHRSDTRDEKAVVLTDALDIIDLAIETAFREAGSAARLGGAAAIARNAVHEAFASFDELARDRTIRL